MGKLFTNRILDVTPTERPGGLDGSVHIAGLQLHHFHFLSSSPQPSGTLVPRPARPCGYAGCRHAGRGSRGAFLASRLRGAPGVKRGPSAGQISRGERATPPLPSLRPRRLGHTEELADQDRPSGLLPTTGRPRERGGERAGGSSVPVFSCRASSCHLLECIVHVYH